MSRTEILDDFYIDTEFKKSKNKFYLFRNGEKICEIKNDTEVFINGKKFLFTAHGNNWQVEEVNNIIIRRIEWVNKYK